MTVVNVDVDLGQDIDQLRERLIQRAAVHLLQQMSPYSEADERFTELGYALREDIAKAMRAEVEKAVGPAVEAALAEGVQRTDNYGSPTGPKVPLREIIVSEAEKVLSRKVEVRDNYGRSESVIQQVIRDEVQRAVADDLKDVIKLEREKVKAAVREQAADIITQSVQRAIA